MNARIRNGLALAMVAGALVACSSAAERQPEPSSSVSSPLPVNESDILYFDSPDGGVVGEYFRGCDGSHFEWGTRTIHYRTMSSSCTGGGSSCACVKNGNWASCPIGWQEFGC